jgi:hypothetical protein
MSTQSIYTAGLPATGYGNITLSTSYTPLSITSSSSNGSLWASTGTYSINNNDIATQTVVLNKEGITIQEGADLRLGNVSLKETLAAIESRLNILRPNPELEAEWEELRELGDRYRQLEAELTEKSCVWKILRTD